MDVGTIRAHIKSHKVQNFYIFTGPEWQGQKIYLNHIAKSVQGTLYRVDSILDVYARLKSKSFNNGKYVYVARDDKDFIQSEKLQAQLSSLLKDNVFILLLTSVDKRTKFYKKYKDSIVEFEYFKEEMLVKYIQKEIDLSPANCKKLIDICESDYGRILLEIDKIRRYADAT